MQGTIAETIGLVLAINARLRGIAIPGWPNASIYTFCNSVTFQQSRRGWFGRQNLIEYADPNMWIEAVTRSAANAQLRVYRRDAPNISDRESVGFVNGGPIFAIEAGGELWLDEWRVTKPDAADNRIWSVVYRTFTGPDGADTPSRDIRAALRVAVTDAVTFAAATKMGFDDQLSEALLALDSANPLASFYHADIVSDDLLDLSARQILGCCAAAWVFGGMGSWNDIGFENHADRSRYEAVSDRLFWALVDGLVIATNSSAP